MEFASEIKPNPKNPRTISKAAFESLKKKIQRNPDGLTANKIVHKDGIIIAGNQRWRAINELGLELQEDWFKDVSGWTEDQIREYLITSNVSDGEWDWDMLANEWDKDELEEWGVDLPDSWKEPEEVEEDEAPEVSSEPPKSKLGEIYQLGRHRVMCGDSTDKASVDLLMDGDKPDGVHTDPPYGFGKKMSGGTWATKASHYSDMHVWDKEAEQAFFDVSVSQGCDAIVWGGNYFVTPPSRGWLIWKKPYFPTTADCEIAYTTKDMNARVFDSNRSDPNKEHPTQKPLAVVTWAMEYLDGNKILDLFLGSGSTLIACEQTNRTCYGMELDPKYVDVTRKRYWKFINNGNEEGWEDGTPAIQ